MFGIGKKRNQNEMPEEIFTTTPNKESFHLPIDDREALGIVSERKKQHVDADASSKLPEEPAQVKKEKKPFFNGLKFSFKKTPRTPEEIKVKKNRAVRVQGTGKKKLIKYYRRILSVAMIFSMFAFAFAFGGRFVLNFLDSSVTRAGGAIPENSEKLYNRFTQLKKKYDQFNFDSFRLLIESDNKSKPQTDEEKTMWRESLVTMFGDNYIRQMKGQAGELRQIEIAEEQNENMSGIVATIPNYSVAGVSAAGNKTLITLHGPTGVEYWSFDSKGKSTDAPEGLVAYGLDKEGKNEAGVPGFKIGVKDYENEHYVFVPLTGVPSQKVVSELEETKRKQSYAAVTTPDGKNKMVSISGGKGGKSGGGKNIVIEPQNNAQNVMPQIGPDGTVTVTNPDGSVDTITLPPEVREQVQGIQQGLENRGEVEKGMNSAANGANQ